MAWLGDVAKRYEVPTWGLVIIIYGGWLALTFCWRDMPVWCVLPAGAWLCAWHMSLQHELMHGHPTRNATINGALAWPPLNLWLPYALYREQHMRHHWAEHLADPLEDPESTYMSEMAWARASSTRRGLHVICNTFIGRVLLGPATAITGFWLGQFHGRSAGCSWPLLCGHAVGVGVILGWVWGVCRINPVVYAACFIYPGTALILIRSLAEHRADMRPTGRTAVVERAGWLALLYLNNNLHAVHHDQPSLPWYALPAQWRRTRSDVLAARRCPLYEGYADVARRYAWRPQHTGPYPNFARHIAPREQPHVATRA